MSPTKGGRKVFVSHASADKDYVGKFVTDIVVRGAGLRSDDIFYTSDADTGVGSGEY
ncbi:hypothetical protein ACH47B_00085 [Rhodococcus sp. NPDC019627]|uniref:hypothetical protein n=1 Tax=unclassified Rhodococcus (in: high G+C Gram-positive bacteria) TaxID=192944 RepID=UPI0033CE3166